VRPGALAHELLQERGRKGGRGLPQIGRVLEIGERGVDVAPVAGVERELPGVVAARLAGGHDLLTPVVVVREDASVEVP